MKRLLRVGDVFWSEETDAMFKGECPSVERPIQFVVVATQTTGGGTGHGPHDVYPDGHQVKAKSLQANGELEVLFYQTGCFGGKIQQKQITLRRSPANAEELSVPSTITNAAKLALRELGRDKFVLSGVRVSYESGKIHVRALVMPDQMEGDRISKC
jgi:hypothetical protein